MHEFRETIIAKVSEMHLILPELMKMKKENIPKSKSIRNINVSFLASNCIISRPRKIIMAGKWNWKTAKLDLCKNARLSQEMEAHYN